LPRVARPRLDRIAWTYVSGLVSALDTRLLPHRATLELLNADGLQELAPRVRQTVMFADLPDTSEPFALAEAMQASYAAAVRRIGDSSPSRSVADLFLLPIEWQAFRGVLREKALGLERGSVPGSSTPAAVWEQCWGPAEAEAPFELFAQAAAAIRDAAPREERTPQLVDTITQAFEARDLRRAADATGSPELAGWVHTWLKLRLALALLRCRLSQWGDAIAPQTIETFGEARQAALALLTEGRRDWRALFAALGLPSVQAIPDDEPLPAVAVERLIDDAMTDLCRSGRGVPFGPEPVFTYLWGLRIEALNLKAIVAGVAAGMSREAIARDIRQTHV